MGTSRIIHNPVAIVQARLPSWRRFSASAWQRYQLLPDGGTTPFKGSKMKHLGRRHARSGGHPLAGAHQAGDDQESTSSRRSTGCRPSSTSPAAPRATASRSRSRPARIRESSRPRSTASIKPTTCWARRRSRPAITSSTIPARTRRRCATRIGRCISQSRPKTRRAS